jgi:hypothetical protein
MLAYISCSHLHCVLITTYCVLLLCAGIANALKRNADIAQALKMAGTAAKLAVQRVAPVNHSKAASSTVGNSGDTDGGEECLMFSCLTENALIHCPFSALLRRCIVLVVAHFSCTMRVR